MEPNEISELLSSGDPEQIKQGQKALQGLGYYDGAIDGQMGPNTVDAIGKYRTDQEEAAERRTEQLGAKRDIAREENRLEKTATELAPYGAGIAAGLGSDYAYKKAYQNPRAQAGTSDIQTLAGREDIDPEVAERKVRGIKRGGTMRSAGRFGAPLGFLAGAYGTREHVAPQFEDEQTRDIVNSMAAGEQAAGLAAGVHGVLSPGQSVGDPVSEAMIESRAKQARAPSPMAQALAGDQARDITPPETATEGRAALPGPDEAEAQGQSVRRSDRAKELARTANIKGRSKLTKTEALDAVRKTVTEDEQARTAVARELNVKPGPNYLQRISKALDDLGPKGAAAVAAALGYDAIRGEAEAEAGTGQPTDAGASMAEALAGGTAAGGAAYGTMKGAQKGAESLGNLASRYAPGAARVAGRAFPPAAAALTAYDLATMPQESVPEDVGRARHERAQGLVNPLGRGRNQQASPMARALAGQ